MLVVEASVGHAPPSLAAHSFVICPFSFAMISGAPLCTVIWQVTQLANGDLVCFAKLGQNAQAANVYVDALIHDD